MDKFLIGSAIVLFTFGALLLIRPDIEKRISDWLNRIFFPLDDKMRSSNKISGLLLVVLGIVIYYLAVKK